MFNAQPTGTVISRRERERGRGIKWTVGCRENEQGDRERVRRQSTVIWMQELKRGERNTHTHTHTYTHTHTQTHTHTHTHTQTHTHIHTHTHTHTHTHKRRKEKRARGGCFPKLLMWRSHKKQGRHKTHSKMPNVECFI